MTGFDAQEFGKVLARLDAQDRALGDLKQELHELTDNVNKLLRVTCADPRETKTKRDWLEILSSAIFGAVAYFIFDHLIGGGK